MTLDGGDSVASRGGLEQEMNVGQLRSRGGRWPLGLLCVLLATGRHGHADTEELSTRYSAHFPAALDLDERQLVSGVGCYGVVGRVWL